MTIPGCLAVLLSLLLALAPVSALAGNSRMLISTDPLMRGLDLASRKYPDEAAVEFDKCKDLSRATAHQLRIIAQTYYDAGHTSSSLVVIAFAISQEKVKREKEDMRALLDLRGNVYAYQNRRDEAISSYEQAAAIDPKAAGYFLPKAGKEMMKIKKYKEAIPLLKTGIIPGTMNGFSYQDIGDCYLELKQPAQAIEPLTTSIRIFVDYRTRDHDAYMPALVQSYKYLIRAYKETGHKKEATIWQKRLDSLIGNLDDYLFGDP